MRDHQWAASIPKKTKSDWEVTPYKPYEAPSCEYKCLVCGTVLKGKAMVSEQSPDMDTPCPGPVCGACNGEGTVSKDSPQVCAICHGSGRRIF